MAEWRTEAQIAADDELARAIGAVLTAYDEEDVNPNEWAVTDYVVVVARAGLSMEKAQNTRYDYLLANGSIPWHHMMGLMDWAQLSMRDGMRGSKEDGDG